MWHGKKNKSSIFPSDVEHEFKLIKKPSRGSQAVWTHCHWLMYQPISLSTRLSHWPFGAPVHSPPDVCRSCWVLRPPSLCTPLDCHRTRRTSSRWPNRSVQSSSRSQLCRNNQNRITTSCHVSKRLVNMTHIHSCIQCPKWIG